MGGRHRVKIVKNKVAAPFRQTEFDMLYGEGISKEGEALALGEKLGLVEKSSGGSYAIGPSSAPPSHKATDGHSKASAGEGIKLGRGYDAARTFLRENKPILKQLLKDIQKGLNDGSSLSKSSASETES